jgi:hypothetical protein
MKKNIKKTQYTKAMYKKKKKAFEDMLKNIKKDGEILKTITNNGIL